MGNIIELCAAELYPDAKTWLGFTMCLTREYWHIPQRELIEDCALEHALDVDALNDCASRDDGAHGMALLRDSVRRTADVGLTKHRDMFQPGSTRTWRPAAWKPVILVVYPLSIRLPAFSSHSI
jgi:hypothetical protein